MNTALENNNRNYIIALQISCNDLLNALQNITKGLNNNADTRPLIKGSEVKAALSAIAKAKEII